MFWAQPRKAHGTREKLSLESERLKFKSQFSYNMAVRRWTHLLTLPDGLSVGERTPWKTCGWAAVKRERADLMLRARP
jgi:hypothetical protein